MLRSQHTALFCPSAWCPPAPAGERQPGGGAGRGRCLHLCHHCGVAPGVLEKAGDPRPNSGVAPAPLLPQQHLQHLVGVLGAPVDEQLFPEELAGVSVEGVRDEVPVRGGGRFETTSNKM